MLNKWIKAAVGAAVGIGIAATAFASTSTIPVALNNSSASQNTLPGVKFTLPALAQNAIDTTIVNVGPYIRPFIGASGVPATIVSSSYGSTVAGDSLNVSIDVGPTSAGPWFNAVNFANAYSHTATLCVRSNIPAHSVIPVCPFWRMRVKSKGTAALTAGRYFYLMFPVVTNAVNK